MERLEIIEGLKRLPYSLEQTFAAEPQASRRKPSLASLATEIKGRVALWHTRLYMVWSMTDPKLPADSEASGASSASVPDLTKEILQTRLKTVDLLSQAVDWTRSGHLPGHGRRSLKQLAEIAFAEDLASLARIDDLTSANS